MSSRPIFSTQDRVPRRDVVFGVNRGTREQNQYSTRYLRVPADRIEQDMCDLPNLVYRINE